MSPAFTKGVGDRLPKAAITFDRFHGVKIINDTVERVRMLHQTRYIWLRNPANLSVRQRARHEGLGTA
jgi:transposase